MLLQIILKYYIVEMMLLKILMLLRQVYLKIVLFAKFDKELRFQPAVCDGCHDVLMMSFSP